MIRAGEQTHRARKGFSLLELLLCMGIAASIFTGLLVLLMSIVTTNRMTGLQIAGLMAARSQAEEILALANSAARLNSSKGGADAENSSTMQFLNYLTSDSLPDGYEVTMTGNPVKRIVCTFPVSKPDFPMRDNEGNRNKEDMTTGIMTVYLDESEVPLYPNGNEVGSLWKDLSRGSAEEGEEGFDINADGKIHKGGLLDKDLQFAVTGIASAYRRIAQLPVDFQITLSDGQGTLSYQTDYRVIITDVVRK